HRVVLDDENVLAAAEYRILRFSVWRVRALQRALEGQLQGKGGAVAGLAARKQLAAHALGEGASDGQAQTGAAIATGDRAVGLLKRVEHARQPLGLDADTRITHGAAEP